MGGDVELYEIKRLVTDPLANGREQFGCDPLAANGRCNVNVDEVGKTVGDDAGPLTGSSGGDGGKGVDGRMAVDKGGGGVADDVLCYSLEVGLIKRLKHGGVELGELADKLLV